MTDDDQADDTHPAGLPRGWQNDRRGSVLDRFFYLGVTTGGALVLFVSLLTHDRWGWAAVAGTVGIWAAFAYDRQANAFADRTLRIVRSLQRAVRDAVAEAERRRR